MQPEIQKVVMRERRGGSRKTPGFGCGGVGVEEGMLSWEAEVLGKNNGKGAGIGSIFHIIKSHWFL